MRSFLTSLSLATLLAFGAAGCAKKPAVAVEYSTAAEHSTLAPVQATSGESTDLTALMVPYRAEVAKLDVPFTESTVAFELKREDGPLASWVADALRAGLSMRTGKQIDIYVQNGGGIRAPLNAGPVAYSTILKVLPFENFVVVIPMSGNDVMALATRLAEMKGNCGISGMEIEATADYKLTGVTVGGANVDAARTYLVGVDTFIAGGGSGFEMLTNFKYENSKALVRDLAFDFAKAEAAAGRKINAPEKPFRFRFGGKTVKEIDP